MPPCVINLPDGRSGPILRHQPGKVHGPCPDPRPLRRRRPTGAGLLRRAGFPFALERSGRRDTPSRKRRLIAFRNDGMGLRGKAFR